MARTFTDWMAAFGRPTTSSSVVTTFCPHFVPRWEEFRDAFADYCESAFGAGAPPRLDDVLPLFHRLHPGYQLLGCIVVAPAFDRMSRFGRDFDISYLNAKVWSDATLSVSKLAAMTDAGFGRIMETLFTEGLSLGGKSGIVWAMDQTELRALVPDFPAAFTQVQADGVVETLGLADMGSTTRIFAFAYPRGAAPDEPQPRTPTHIDGMPNPYFVAVTTCTKSGGMTVSPGGIPGKPEAVHRAIVLRDEDWVASRLTPP